MGIHWLLIFLWTSCSAVQTHQVWLGKNAARKGFEERTLEIGDHRIHHWVGGQGPPVLLLHGFGGDGLITWWQQARALSKTHRVIIPDLLWFGGSDSNAPPSLDAQAEAMGALVEELVASGQPIDVVGISYGGFVALRYGSLEPQRQGRLVLMDSPGPHFGDQDEARLLEHFGVEHVEEIFVPTDTTQVRTLIGLAYHKPPPLPDFVLADLKERVFSAHQNEQRALLADLKEGRERYRSAPLAEYAESLVIWGQHDVVFPLSIGRTLAKEMDAEFFVVEQAGHAPHMDRPGIVRRKLQSFLSP